MKIERKNTCVTISHNGQDLTFTMPNIAPGRLRPGMTTTQNKRQSEFEYFFELNELWGTFSEERCNKLFELYEDVYALSTEGSKVCRKHIPSIAEAIINAHPIEEVRNLYPVKRIWIPEDMQESFDSVCTNYVKEMTYLVKDYYNLVTLGIVIRSLVPLFAAVNAFSTTTRNRSVEETRETVYNTIFAYKMVMGTCLAEDPAMEKLDAYLSEATVRIQKENKATGRGAASVAVIAVFEGFGTDSLDDYFRGYALVAVLSNNILNPVHEFSHVARTTSLATSIYKGVMAEIKTNLAKKLSSDTIRERVHASKFRMYGEESKVSAIDIIAGQSNAPMKVAALSTVAIRDYRRCIKHLDKDIAPADAKVYIDNMLENPPEYFTILHEWLIGAVFRYFLDRRSLPDIRRDSDAMPIAAGIAQACYVSRGYPEVAKLLSCTATFCEDRDFVYSLDSLSKEFKEKLDIYYPQGFNESDSRTRRKKNPGIENIELLINEYILPYKLNIKVNEEVQQRLKLEQCEMDYRPHYNLRNDLAEWLCRTIKNRQAQKATLI